MVDERRNCGGGEEELKWRRGGIELEKKRN